MSPVLSRRIGCPSVGTRGFTQKQKAQGASTIEALLIAGPVRLRPILMTTAAMILGMLPVALALGEGGEARAPMAVVVIGGLITSTVLTLVVVPVVFSLIEGLRGRLRGLLGRLLGSDKPPSRSSTRPPPRYPSPRSSKAPRSPAIRKCPDPQGMLEGRYPPP